jgi:hypothetical protein
MISYLCVESKATRPITGTGAVIFNYIMDEHNEVRVKLQEHINAGKKQ